MRRFTGLKRAVITLKQDRFLAPDLRRAEELVGAGTMVKAAEETTRRLH